MKMRKSIALLLTICCVLIGFLLPFLSIAFKDLRMEQAHWTFSQEDAHYTYQGTLLNRVLAVGSFLNHSPAVQETSRAPSAEPDSLWDSLAPFLPLPDRADCRAEAFTLAPVQYSAEYRYVETEYAGDSFLLNVITDAESGLPLRIELTCAPEILSAHLKEFDVWRLLKEYAALLNLGSLADGNTSISTLIHSQSADIRGTALRMTATVMPSAGTLLIKLTGNSAA